MADLEYRIGGLNVNPGILGFTGSEPYSANHKFIAEASGNVVSIYVAEGKKHRHVVEKFNLPNRRLVGGGSCYLNAEEQLVLDDFSGDYNAIPKEVAQRFAELMLPELEKLGVRVNGIAVNPKKYFMNSYWQEHGFGSQ